MGFGAGDANLYRYAGNGQTNASDPSGYADKDKPPNPADKDPLMQLLRRFARENEFDDNRRIGGIQRFKTERERFLILQMRLRGVEDVADLPLSDFLFASSRAFSDEMMRETCEFGEFAVNVVGPMVVRGLQVASGLAAVASGQGWIVIVIGGVDIWLGADGIAAHVDGLSGGPGRTITNRGLGDTGEIIANIGAGGSSIGIGIVTRSGRILTSGGRGRWLWGFDRLSDADARAAYDAIRASGTDIAAIARYTGYKPERLQRIKDYLFNNAEFVPDELIAAAWHRLRTGRGNAIDRLLLKHETAEMWLRNSRGCDYWDAHRRANPRWNWGIVAEDQ
jgi:hypothetical protein